MTAKPIDARRDSATVQTGQQVTVDVTANDRAAGPKRKARIKIIAIPIPNGLNITPAGRRKVLVAAASVTPPGTYTARYRIIDAAGRADGATIVIIVTAPTTTTPTPAPTSTGAITESSTRR